MKYKKPKPFILVLLVLSLICTTAKGECPVLCEECQYDDTCKNCYNSFVYGSSSQYLTEKQCSCPSGFYKTVSNLCLFCPSTCQTCINAIKCSTCIAGYEIDNTGACSKKVSNEGQWISRQIAHDLTNQKLTRFDIEGWYILNHVNTPSIRQSVQSCSGFSNNYFFGLYAFDYNTELIKSYFGLPSHGWAQIRFNFIAADRWNQTDMILEINDQESYSLDTIEGVISSESKKFSSSQRLRDFCMKRDPDNMGSIDLSIAHTESMLKIRIRTSLSEATPSSLSDYENYVFFGIRDVFVRVGTCPMNCEKCFAPDRCSECKAPYVADGQGKCICDSTIAQETSTGECKLNCLAGFIFKTPSGSTEERCILCSEQLNDECLICSKASNSVIKCDVCQEGYFLHEETCKPECPSKFEKSLTQLMIDFNKWKGQCVACSSNCQSCEFEVCLECDEGYNYLKGECMKDCPDGMFSDGKNCLACGQDCAKCTSSSVCTECINPDMFALQKGHCVPSCLLSADGCIFEPCNAVCSKCFGPQNNQCLECTTSSSLLSDHSCSPQCSQGYFNMLQKCISCEFPCTSCKNNQVCTSCSQGYFLFQQQCQRTCPLSSFPDSTTKTCQKCSSRCLQCLKADVCISCLAGTTLLQGQCVEDPQCGSGKYYDERVNSCLDCGDNCEICQRDLCLKCYEEKFLDNGQCVTDCSAEKTLSTETFKINSVNTQVKVCVWKNPLCQNYKIELNTDPVTSKCSQCIFMNPLLALHQLSSQNTATCQFTCPVGYYKLSTQSTVSCQVCPNNCQQCLNSEKCVQCTNAFVLSSQSKCLNTCPEGYISDGFQCQQCKAYCKQCQINDVCRECKTGYKFSLDGNCIPQQQIEMCEQDDNGNAQYYSVGASQCQSCSEQCETCVYNAQTCTSCLQPKYLKGTICVDVCYNATDIDTSNDGWYPTGQQFSRQICKKCPAVCQNCLSSTECIECVTGFFLLRHPIMFQGQQTGTCVQNCASGYYNYNPLNTAMSNSDQRKISTCEFCSPNCLTCFGPSQDQCLTCYGDFKLDHNSRCVENCPLRKYADSYGHCDWCHESCLKCWGPAFFQCKQCADDQYLYSGACWNNSCPASTYMVDYDTRACELCQWGCQVCYSPYNCSVCTGGFYLYEGWCYLQCPYNTRPYLETQTNRWLCGPCNKTWASCVECSQTGCKMCQENLFLGWTSNGFNRSCLEECPKGFYAVLSVNQECVPCPKSCAKCLSPRLCTDCQDGFILQSDNRCVKRCYNSSLSDVGSLISQYYDLQKQICKNCSTNCQMCLNYGNCIQCRESLYMISITQQSATKCVQTCPQGYYPNQANQRCTKCSLNCKKCLSASKCTECIDGYQTNLGSCYQKNLPFIPPKCHSSVKNCSQCLMNIRCGFCEIPYYLYDNKCIEECPTGYFQHGRECQQCSPSCLECESTSATKCTKCFEGTYLLKNQCWKECPPGYTSDASTSMCTRCSFVQCYQCSSDRSVCQACNPDYFLYQGNCLSICPSHTFASAKQCVKCPDSCAQCLSFDKCVECDRPYVLSNNGMCISQCPIDSYLNEQTLMCEQCQFPCVQCSINKASCISCGEGYSLLVNQSQLHSQSKRQCVSNCPSGYYSKVYPTSGSKCEQCSNNKCKTCINSTTCSSCAAPYKFWNGNCHASCPSGTYSLLQEQFCRQCAAKCLQCQNNGSCSMCHSSLLLYQGKCIEFCSVGKYQATQFSFQLQQTISTCKPCLSPCKTCNNAYECKSCEEGFFYLLEQAGKCVKDCPKFGYYKNEQEGKCSRCLTACSKCQNGTKCQQCWEEGWQLSTTYQCVPVDPCKLQNCLVCQKQEDEDGSDWEYYQDEQGEGEGSGLEESGAEADSGSASTSKNITFKSECLQCLSPYVLIKTDLLKILSQNDDNINEGATQCVRECPFKTYLSAEQGQPQCFECFLDCKECSGGDQNQCLSCQSMEHYLFKGTCLLSCPQGFQQNYYTRTCDAVICQKGNSQNFTCSKCLSPYLIQNGQCLTKCSTGYFKEGAYCQKCSLTLGDYCLECSSSTKCTKCILANGYFLSANKCINQCPTGQLISTVTTGIRQTKKCQTCSMYLDNCQQCNSNQSCTKCQYPFILFDNICVSECDQSMYISSADKFTAISVAAEYSSLQCLNCPQNCRKCSNGTYCYQCQSPYIWFEGTCIKWCPEGWYQQDSSDSDKICRKCHSTCVSCAQNQAKCFQCVSPYLKAPATTQGSTSVSITVNGVKVLKKIYTCVISCPQRYFQGINSTCIKCNNNCRQCSSNEVCQSCDVDKYLLNGKCQDACPDGYFANFNKCLMCDPECKTCKGREDICETCYQNMTIDENNNCVANCEMGMYLNELWQSGSEPACKPCSANCESCFGPRYDNCLTCKDPLSLYNRVCVQRCPDGLYRDSNTVCKLCDAQKCLTCEGSPTNCTQCSFSKKLIVMNNKDQKSGYCGYECPFSTFYQTATSTCQSCPSNCLLCVNENVCTVCISSTYLFDGYCLSQCPQGFANVLNNTLISVVATNFCKKCPIECVKCTYSLSDNSEGFKLNCQECKDQFYFYGGRCYGKKCPLGSFSDLVLNPTTCVACESKCLTCTSTVTCTSCVYPYLLKQSECVSQCLQGYVIKSSSNSRQCVEKQTCDGYTFQDDECLNYCPIGTYAQKTPQGKSTHQCKRCPALCQQCQSQSNCQKCTEDNFSIVLRTEADGQFTAECVSICPLSTYENNGYCISCPMLCSECYAEKSQIHCTKCEQVLEYYLLEDEGRCIETCDGNGYYVEYNSQDLVPKRKCSKCSPKCKTCDNNGCLQCFNQQYLEPQCVQPQNNTCTEGYYVVPMSGACDDCHQACQTCFGPGINECTSCKNLTVEVQGVQKQYSYSLKSSSCLIVCPTSYVEDQQNNLCVKCAVKNCLLCELGLADTKCTTCMTGYIRYEYDLCVKSCQQLEYLISDKETSYVQLNNQDNSQKKCIACQTVTNCKNCYATNLSIPIICIECKDGFLLYNETQQCLQACPKTTFTSEDGKHCIPCDGLGQQLSETTQLANPYCQECQKDFVTGSTKSQIKCTLCKTEFLLGADGICIEQCPVGFFQNQQRCIQCSANCKDCIHQAACIECLTPYKLQSGACETCMSGYFLNIEDKCQRCESPCKECTTSAGKCTSCQEPNMILLDSRCITSCPTGQFYDSSTKMCTYCSSGCVECNKDECTACDNALFAIYNGDGIVSCQSSCPNGYYANSFNKCLKCEQELFKCQQCKRTISTSISNVPGSLMCTKCIDTYYLWNGQCLSECPIGYTKESSSSNVCTPCQSGCKVCNFQGCLTCKDNLVKEAGATGRCIPPINTCQSHQFKDFFDECRDCHPTCKTCSRASRTGCLTCDFPDYILKEDGSCEVTCEEGMYFDDVASQCAKCSSKYDLGQGICGTCDSDSCSSCSTGYLSLDKQSCMQQCPTGSYPDLSFNQCFSCPQNCAECLSLINCTACKTDKEYILFNDMCYAECPEGSVKGIDSQSNPECQLCSNPSKCAACSIGVDNCTACISPYYLNKETQGNSSQQDNGNCIDKCPDGTYASDSSSPDSDPSSTRQCIPCQENCNLCQESGCISCQVPYMLYNKTCVDTCPTRFYYYQNLCLECEFPCTSCIRYNYNCTSCADGYVFNSVKGTCSSECPDYGYYLKIQNNQTTCQLCEMQNCIKCDQDKCYQCVEGMFAMKSLDPSNGLSQIDSCQQVCPETRFSNTNTNTCDSCEENCRVCVSSTQCQKCLSPYYLFNNSDCVKDCPITTYSITVENNLLICKDCLPLCDKCENQNRCQQCSANAGLYIQTGLCYDSCPEGTYSDNDDPDSQLCMNCTMFFCSKCSANECFKCKDGYFAMDNDKDGVINKCVPNCGDGYYADIANKQCKQCLSECKECVQPYKCEQCNTDFSLLKMPKSPHSCVDQCPGRYFKTILTEVNTSPTAYYCQSCEANCLYCLNRTKCTECINEYSLHFTDTSNTTQVCLNDCPEYYYSARDDTANVEVCKLCSKNCLQCLDQTNCTVCESTHTLIENRTCVPHYCVNCRNCDLSVEPPVCTHCMAPEYFLYFVRCSKQCPVYFYSNTTTYKCESCTENCIQCTTSTDCQECLPDYIYIQGKGCVNEAVETYGQAANMSGWTSNVTETMSTIYLATSTGPVAFGQMTTTYFNIEFCQFLFFHEGADGNNPEMKVFLESLQGMSLTNRPQSNDQDTNPRQQPIRRRLQSSNYRSNFLQTNIPIFILMGAFLAIYIAIVIFRHYIDESCRISCNNCWFYADTIADFMQKRFKWIYFDFVMWISYLPFLYFALLQLISFNFDTGAQGFSSILAIVIIAVYPLYPVWIGYLIRKNYEDICVDPEAVENAPRHTLIEMSLSPYLSKVKRPLSAPAPYAEPVEFRWLSKSNFILAYYPLKYFRKFIFVLIVAVVPGPINIVGALIGMNVLFIAYMFAFKPREMPYLAFDFAIEFVLLAFEVFLLTYLVLDGGKIAIMSIVTHTIGFIIANLSLAIAIILNLIAYYKIFMCLKQLYEHVSEKAAERQQAKDKFEKQKQFLDPTSHLFEQKEIDKLKNVGQDSETDSDNDEQLTYAHHIRKLAENLGQKELLLNGINPVQYAKDLSKKEKQVIQEKQKALKMVNADDNTDSDDESLDQNIINIMDGLDEKHLALNQIHPVKYAKALTMKDAPLQDQYKKFDDKHVDGRIGKMINQDDLTDSDDDDVDDDVMRIARNLQLNEKQLAANQINPVKFLKDQTKKDAPLQEQYKKFDDKHVDKRIGKMINQDDLTDSDDDDDNQDVMRIARNLQLNEKQLAANQINPVKFLKDQTKKDAPLQDQYKKFDQKHISGKVAKMINQGDDGQMTSSDDDEYVDNDQHKIARNLQLNEKQLAFNQIDPVKFFRQETKKEAPLQQQYSKFDEKHIDKKLAMKINGDKTDSDTDEDDQWAEERDRIARDLQLNEKQLAGNNINPIKLAQRQAKQKEKLDTLMRKFDEKDIDMKVARMINEQQKTDSEEDSDDQDRYDLARQFKLDEKDLAVNQINPLKLAKKIAKEDQMEPVKLQKKRQRLMQRRADGMRRNVDTDSEEEQDNGHPINKKITEGIQGKKRLKKKPKDIKQGIKEGLKNNLRSKKVTPFDEDNYDLPDFKIAKPKQKKQNSKVSGKDIRGSQKLPSSDGSDGKSRSMNFMDSESEQNQTVLLKEKKVRSNQVNSKQEEKQDDVEFYNRPFFKNQLNSNSSKLSENVQNFNSEQSSEMALNFNNGHQQSFEDIKIAKPAPKIINLDSMESKNKLSKIKGSQRAVRSGKPISNSMRGVQDKQDLFNEFKEAAVDQQNVLDLQRDSDDLEDLENVHSKDYKEKKHQNALKTLGTQHLRKNNNKIRDIVQGEDNDDQLQQISGNQKSYKSNYFNQLCIDAKHKRNSKVKQQPIAQSIYFRKDENKNDNDYEEMIKNNKKEQRYPNFKDKTDFQDIEFDKRPKSGNSIMSNGNSDSEDEYSKQIRKARNSNKSSLRVKSRKKNQKEQNCSQQITPNDSRRNSRASSHKEGGIRSGRLAKLKIEQLSEDEGDDTIEKIQI